MWMNQDLPEVLATERKIGLIREFAAMTPHGGVVLTGGEPFMRERELFALSMTCRHENLLCVVNTNGTYITDEMVPRLLRDGPQHLVFSLDSMHAKSHDYIRGRVGTYQKVLAAVRQLLKERDANRSLTRIYISSILYDANIAESTAFVEFSRQLGIDGVTFQMLDRTFSSRSKRDKFFESNWFKYPEDAKYHVDTLANLYANDPFVLLSRRDFDWMKIYIDSPDILPVAVCDAHIRNFMIDMYGEVRLCSHMKEINQDRTLGNIAERSLEYFWNCDAASSVRSVMSNCTKTCGMLNCHRKAEA
jgi:hypothetical protein